VYECVSVIYGCVFMCVALRCVSMCMGESVLVYGCVSMCVYGCITFGWHWVGMS
jgi:hypothetical protein